MTAVGFVVIVIIDVASIIAARWLARRKHRLPGNWGLAALLVGPLAVIVLAVLPRGTESVGASS